MVSKVGFAIGIDLGGTKIRGGLVAADGTVSVVDEHATDTSNAQAIVDQIVAMARKLGTGRDLTGVGIGVPGTVEQPTGTLIQAVNLPLRTIALRDLIGHELEAPVLVENDGNCAALGEHRFGAAAGTTHSVTLTLGTGVGGGIVADGRLLSGARGTGGELGHIVIERNGRPCQGSCPGRGHLEAYCSGTALGARGREAGFGDAHDVLARAAKGEPGALELIDELSAALGAGLVSLANVLAPNVFVIGGGLGDAGADLILPRAGKILRTQALPPNGEARLGAASLGNDAGMIGAACLVLP
jgi:glucokinase